jgi:hypothetical protein
VLGEDMRPGIEVACRMVEGRGIARQRHHLLFRAVPDAVLPQSAAAGLRALLPATAQSGYRPLVEDCAPPQHGAHPSVRREGGQYYYNSQPYSIARGAMLGTYRKTHIPAILPSGAKGGTGSYEKFYFTPGDALPIFEMEGVRFGSRSATTANSRKARVRWPSRAPRSSSCPSAPQPTARTCCAAILGAAAALPRLRERRVRRRRQSRRQRERPPHIGKSMIVNPVGAP